MCENLQEFYTGQEIVLSIEYLWGKWISGYHGNREDGQM